MWGLVGWPWVWPLVAQLSEYPQAEPIGLFRLLCSLGFGLVTTGYVIVPTGPATVVLGCAAPRFGHPTSMTPGAVGVEVSWSVGSIGPSVHR